MGWPPEGYDIDENGNLVYVGMSNVSKGDNKETPGDTANANATSDSGLSDFFSGLFGATTKSNQMDFDERKRQFDEMLRVELRRLGLSEAEIAEKIRQFDLSLAENSRQFNQGLYSSVGMGLLSGASSLHGQPKDWIKYGEYTTGGKNLFDRLQGNTPAPAFGAPTGYSEKMEITDILDALGIKPGSISTKPAAGGGNSTGPITGEADAIERIFQMRPDIAKVYAGLGGEWATRLQTPEGRREIILDWLAHTPEQHLKGKSILDAAGALGIGTAQPATGGGNNVATTGPNMSATGPGTILGQPAATPPVATQPVTGKGTPTPGISSGVDIAKPVATAPGPDLASNPSTPGVPGPDLSNTPIDSILLAIWDKRPDIQNGFKARPEFAGKSPIEIMRHWWQFAQNTDEFMPDEKGDAGLLKYAQRNGFYVSDHEEAKPIPTPAPTPPVPATPKPAQPQVPLPHQINPLVWDSMPDSVKQIYLGAAEAGNTPSGVWTAEDYLRQLNASRPKGTAPRQVRYNWGQPGSYF